MYARITKQDYFRKWQCEKWFYTELKLGQRDNLIALITAAVRTSDEAYGEAERNRPDLIRQQKEMYQVEMGEKAKRFTNSRPARTNLCRSQLRAM